MTAGPALPALGRGLGVGLDLPWGAPIGFATDDAGREGASPRLRAFLRREAGRFNHVFFSFQPRDRGQLALDDYAPAWDDLCAALPPGLPRALHHTALNLAALERAPGGRGELYDFTNALCARYRIGWINEDVGFWSLAGRPLPYPLPPLLDRQGLAACVRNVREAARELVAPLVLEFPGFAAGVSLVLGDLDAYDFFRALAEETGAPVTLDVAHLISWRWWRGFRGDALYDELERLPLSSCFELHLSGCEIAGERFIDAHHGRLLDEQLTMLGRLLPLCPALRAITFEDPRLDAEGTMEPASARSLARLDEVVGPWARLAPAPGAEAAPRAPVAELASHAPDAAEVRGPGEPPHEIERTLGALLFDREARAAWREGRRARPFDALDPEALEEAAGAVRAMVRERRHRGTGRLAELFPLATEAWRRRHPDDTELDELVARFLASPSAAAWREGPGVEAGACLEACFAAFLLADGISDAVTCEEELLSASLRALAVTPAPSFRPPPGVHRGPGGWFAVSGAELPILHAANRQGYLRGPVTPLIVSLLDGAPLGEAAARHGVTGAAAAAVAERLHEMGLLARRDNRG